MGIDPGYKKTGFGIIKNSIQFNKYIVSGCIYSNNLNIVESFKIIFNDLIILIKKYKPHVISIENIFVYQNRNSILKLAQTRGVVIAAAGTCNIDLVEYSPKKIKKLVSGYGGVDKNNMRFIIKKILNLKYLTSIDSADALAIAICHSNLYNYH